MMIRKIGIIGAMEEEVEALRERLVRPQRLTRASMDFIPEHWKGMRW